MIYAYGTGQNKMTHTHGNTVILLIYCKNTFIIPRQQKKNTWEFISWDVCETRPQQILNSIAQAQFIRWLFGKCIMHVCTAIAPGNNLNPKRYLTW